MIPLLQSKLPSVSALLESVGCFFLTFLVWSLPVQAEILSLDNGMVKVGIDDSKGASITWLSWSAYPKNGVNHADPGRLIQQSYYAGKTLDRKTEGQSKAWSPWPWNPIQGGGVSSWARVKVMLRTNEVLYGETVPKLWDMPNEPAAALMRQWIAFEPAMTNVVVVRCEFLSQRTDDDRWGGTIPRAQEIPACYFTRNFSTAKTYIGDGQWQVESQPPGPPWGQATPPRKAMAFFNAEGQGVAIFSPGSAKAWNFGPHGGGDSDDPAAGPCMHVAPLDNVSLGPKSEYRFRYWLVIGTEVEIADRLDLLWEKYSGERGRLSAGDFQAAPNIAPVTAPKQPGIAQQVQRPNPEPPSDSLGRPGRIWRPQWFRAIQPFQI